MQEARAAEILDEFSQQFMQLSPHLRFAAAETPQEREAVYRARYAEVVRRGWAAPEDMPDGIERDEYDDDALHIVGWDGDVMMIIGRLVFPSPDRPLPTEAAYDLVIEPRQQVVDSGRAIRLQPDHGDSQHAMFLGLMSYAWQAMRERGYQHICGVMATSIFEMYKRMGIHWEVLGEPRSYWGEMRLPCKFDQVKTVESFLTGNW